ncbi:chromate transporter [soil metagenome]
MDNLNATAAAPKVTKAALFYCFLSMGLNSFGGVLPWARRMLVEQRGWLTSEEFVDALSLGQMLPGPNVVNLSIMVGARFHGALGALLAFTGLMLAPFAIILMLAALYSQYGHLDSIKNVFRGLSAASAGLVVAMGFNMVLRHSKSWISVSMIVLTLVGAGIMRYPLLTVLAVLAPISIALAWRKPR